MFKKIAFLGMTTMIVLGGAIAPVTSHASEKEPVKSNELIMKLGSEVKKEATVNNGTLTVEKVPSNSALRMKDSIYKMYWKSFDGKFNVGFTGIVADNQFVDVYDEWNQLYGMRATQEKLSIKNSQRAVYDLRVTDGWRTWDQHMISTIDWTGTMHVDLTHS